MNKNEYIAKIGFIYGDLASTLADVALVCAETDGVSNEIVSMFIDMSREYNNKYRMCIDELEKEGKDYE